MSDDSKAHIIEVDSEEYADLHRAAETLSYIHSALIGASLATNIPGYRVLALSLLEMFEDGTVRERMDRMQDVLREHRHELR